MEITTNIDNDLSRVLSKLCRKKAKEIQVPMVIAFSGVMGDMVHFERMSNALPVSIDIAMNKAYTAAAVKLPTHTIAEVTGPGQPLYGLQNTDKGRVVIFGGGFPLHINGEIIGAVGVSGGAVEEDMAVATAAVEGLAQMEEMATALRDKLPETLQDYEAFVKQAESLDALGGISADVLEGAFYIMQSI
jgi:uncharacterized protein GlcG (DUF336 family)